MPGTKTLHLPSSVKTGGLVLPSGVSSEVEAEQRAMVDQMEDTADALAYWSRELQVAFDDPDVRVVMAKPNTTVIGLKGGYFHIIRMRPGTAAWIQPIEGPNGEWRDLDSSVLDIALKADLWNDRTQRELRKQREAVEKAHKLRKQREAQDRAGDFDERLKSMMNTSISVPRKITNATLNQNL